MSAPGLAMAADEVDDASRLLAARLAGFLRTLRDSAFSIGLGEAQDAAALIAHGYAAKPELLRSALKHLLAARKADWQAFDGLFDAFWLDKHSRSRASAAAASANANPPSLRSLRDGAGGGRERLASGDDGSGQAASGEGRAEGASRVENLAEVDFRKLTEPADMAEAHAVAALLARAMRARLTRRDRARRRGYRLDLRRTIHKNIRHGGVPIRLVRRRRKEKPLRLVILLDASGSMSLYTGLFLRFIHGVLDAFREAEAFLFHTRLAHVSDAMKERDAARALDRLSVMAQGSGGGTRIGESLRTFNRWHAARVIHSRTCVMIVSDGYETGDAALLGREMAALGRRCRRIVWLNPMLGWEGYAPEAAGIKAALPHVDLFAPAHTLDSLAALEPYLARL